jgi:probable HAF family extracellular repeat protein/autotransporter-associated beta strand protein
MHMIVHHRSRLLALIALSGGRTLATVYSMTDLGTLGGTNTTPAGINLSGEIVGNSTNVAGTRIPFIYANGQMTSLGMDGNLTAFARQINSSGEVEGSLSNGDLFVWKNGQYMDLGTPLGSTNVRGNGFNDAGEITGQMTTTGGEIHGFLYNPADGGSSIDIGTLGGAPGDFSYGSSINSSGQIEGDSINAGGLDHAFIWTAGQWNDLGTFGGAASSGIAVNNEGHATGTAEEPAGTDGGTPVLHPFLYNGKTMVDCGTLGGDYGNAGGMNDLDQIVGYSYLANNTTQNAFIYGNGVMTNLNSLIPAGSGWTLTGASGINDAGLIAATGVNGSGQTHTFLLTPMAPTLTWNNAAGNGDGKTWDTASENWDNGSGAAVYGDTATVTFNDDNENNYSVTLDATVSPGSIVFNNSAGNYAISGTGLLAGSGIATISTPSSYTGGTIVNDGTLVISPTAVAGAVALPDGPVSIGAAGRLELADGAGESSPNSEASQLLQISWMSITAGGVMDIRNNHFFVADSGGAADDETFASILGWIKDGAIVSTKGLAGYGVGLVDGDDGVSGAIASFGQIEVAYTLEGDANLDGKVDATDFGIFAPNFGLATSLGWEAGDFNYDGKVDAGDFAAFAPNFGLQDGGTALGLPAADLAALDAFASANGLPLPSVPEPACGVFLAGIVIGTLLKRRRGRKIRSSC